MLNLILQLAFVFCTFFFFGWEVGITCTLGLGTFILTLGSVATSLSNKIMVSNIEMN